MKFLLRSYDTRALFQEKGVDADEVLARHAGQFFRILSMEHLKLYDGTEEMLSAIRKRGKNINIGGSITPITQAVVL